MRQLRNIGAALARSVRSLSRAGIRGSKDTLGRRLLSRLGKRGSVSLADDVAQAAERGLFAEHGIVPGRGINSSIPSAAGGKSYITYGFKNANGEVVYVGRASGLGTPEQVLRARLAKGHKYFDNSLTPFVADVQKSKLANQGAEEFFIQGYRELGAPLRNIDESLSFSSGQRTQKSLRKLDAFFEDLFGRSP